MRQCGWTKNRITQDFIWGKHFLVRLSQRMSGLAGKAFAALPASGGLNVFFQQDCVFSEVRLKWKHGSKDVLIKFLCSFPPAIFAPFNQWSICGCG